LLLNIIILLNRCTENQGTTTLQKFEASEKSDKVKYKIANHVNNCYVYVCCIKYVYM